ncbi:hypothetical protein D6D01_10293, partial [Aureobasidium pullulans]
LLLSLPGDLSSESLRPHAPGFATLDFIQELHQKCHRLEELTLCIFRSEDDANEIAICRALRSLAPLRRIHLSIYCPQPFTWDYESCSNFNRILKGNGEVDVATRAELDNALMYLAVDETLARQIFHTISSAKAAFSPPLERLDLRVETVDYVHGPASGIHEMIDLMIALWMGTMAKLKRHVVDLVFSDNASPPHLNAWQAQEVRHLTSLMIDKDNISCLDRRELLVKGPVKDIGTYWEVESDTQMEYASLDEKHFVSIYLLKAGETHWGKTPSILTTSKDVESCEIDLRSQSWHPERERPMQSLKFQVQISRVSDVQCSAMSGIQYLKDRYVSENDSQASETDDDSTDSLVSVLDDMSRGPSTKPPSQVQVKDAAHKDSDDDDYGSSFDEQLDFSMQSWEEFEITEVSRDTPASVREGSRSPVKWRTLYRDATPAKTTDTTAVSSTSRPQTATMQGTIKTHQLGSSEAALFKYNKTTENRVQKTSERSDKPKEIDRERFLVVMEELRATRQRIEDMDSQISQEMSDMENNYSIRHRS